VRRKTPSRIPEAPPSRPAVLCGAIPGNRAFLPKSSRASFRMTNEKFPMTNSQFRLTPFVAALPRCAPCLVRRALCAFSRPSPSISLFPTIAPPPPHPLSRQSGNLNSAYSAYSAVQNPSATLRANLSHLPPFHQIAPNLTKFNPSFFKIIPNGKNPTNSGRQPIRPAHAQKAPKKTAPSKPVKASQSRKPVEQPLVS